MRGTKLLEVPGSGGVHRAVVERPEMKLESTAEQMDTVLPGRQARGDQPTRTLFALNGVFEGLAEPPAQVGVLDRIEVIEKKQ